MKDINHKGLEYIQEYKIICQFGYFFIHSTVISKQFVKFDFSQREKGK
jgi:hypothetical protein